MFELQSSLEIAGQRWKADLRRGTSLAIPLTFAGPQPSCFGAPPAERVPWEVSGFVGSTNSGGSCNVDSVQLIPHCNGTHTESVGHILHEPVPVHHVAPRRLLFAQLLSLSPERLDACGETYSDFALSTDLVLSARLLQETLWPGIEALLIRSLPNPTSKLVRDWSQSGPAPYLSLDAVDTIVARGIEHLLLDLPSLDRGEDGGLLAAHHRFWNVVPGAREATSAARRQATVSELLFIPDSIVDGLYLLDLQVAPWLTDAAPSNPLVFPLTVDSP